jgi:hypothetical protein
MSTDQANTPELTADVAAKIIEALRSGKHRDTAACGAGITREQFEKHLSSHGAFRQDVCDAETEASMARLTLMRQRAKVGHPVDRQWLKRHPAEVQELEAKVAAMNARRVAAGLAAAASVS